MSEESQYTLKRGESGAARLELLGEAMWPTTHDFLTRAGLCKGLRCLDMGCGVGVVSRKIADITGHCLGVDPAPGFIELARSAGSPEGLSFLTGDLDSFVTEELFDVVYCRYLLSHLARPRRTMRQLIEFLKPGGTLLIEDIDFPFHIHHPPSLAFQRYLELYQAVVSRNGGDACIGRELLPAARAVGLQNIDSQCVVSLHHHGASKRVAELTLAHISESLIQAGLCSPQELSDLLVELKRYRRDPDTQISIAPTFQLRGSKA